MTSVSRVAVIGLGYGARPGARRNPEIGHLRQSSLTAEWERINVPLMSLARGPVTTSTAQRCCEFSIDVPSLSWHPLPATTATGHRCGSPPAERAKCPIRQNQGAQARRAEQLMEEAT